MIGPEASDDAGVYRFDGRGLVATTDFITPVCDEPRRFGRVAAANALSDVYALGGRPMFALNICCFPEDVPLRVLEEILAGAWEKVREAGAVLLGGHSVQDRELKFGLAVVGEAALDRLLPISAARPGDVLVLTKPLGTGVLVNAFKFDKLDAAGLEPALLEMERLNAEAARLALEHGAHAATDVTGFGVAGHALNLARASEVTIEIDYDALPVHAAFFDLARRGVSTGCTKDNERHVGDRLTLHRSLAPEQRELLFDPQTSGGLLIALPADQAAACVESLTASGHRAATVGHVHPGESRLRIA